MGYVGDVRQQHANCYIYSIIACHHLHVITCMSDNNTLYI